MVVADVSSSCIYTIKALPDLDGAWLRQKTTTFSERTNWATASRLLIDAQNRSQRLPVLFATAETIDCLRYLAFLKKIVVSQVDEKHYRTSYTFTDLRQLARPYPLSSLQVVSTRKPLSERFIRPYAICHTPRFVLDEALAARPSQVAAS